GRIYLAYQQHIAAVWGTAHCPGRMPKASHNQRQPSGNNGQKGPSKDREAAGQRRGLPTRFFLRANTGGSLNRGGSRSFLLGRLAEGPTAGSWTDKAHLSQPT